MFTGIVRCSARSGTARKRLTRRAGTTAAVLGTALISALAISTPALAQTVTEVSSDPFPASSAPTAAHATEVEPDTFANGSTVVTAFQTGRVFNGGSSDIGFATSTNGGATWTHGFLPDTTTASTPTGTFFAVSDVSVAFDARAGVWILSWLGLHVSGGGVVDVMDSRSTDGLTWSNPITIAATGTFYDKNWSVCDNTPTSPHYGNCYTEFDNASSRDLEQMATSTDGGLTWGTPMATADLAHGLGGQPVVQPNGRVVVPYEGIQGKQGQIRAFTSDNGGASWNTSVNISKISSHRVAGLRTSPLPSAEINAAGVVYVAWQDSRFEDGAANDIVLSTSANGTTWSKVTRIPIDPVGSNVDHFIPGLAVDHSTSGASTQLALTYYYDTNPSCTGSTCQIQVGFVSSVNNGATWSAPVKESGPMELGWLAPTNQGVMVGDYISTSFLAGQKQAIGAFTIASAPSSGGALDEPMFVGLDSVTGGTTPTTESPAVITGSSNTEASAF
jgi:hypothetical protein